MSTEDGEKSGRLEKIFTDFNESWMTYWGKYVDLQNQLYESVKAARRISWLGATNFEKLGEINQTQRELFASMPRRIDYEPLGQVSRNLDSAMGKIDELEAALSVEKEKCGELEEAIEALRGRLRTTRQELLKQA